MTAAYTELVYLVGEDESPPITVRADAENPHDFVHLATDSGEARQYWGEVSLCLPKDVAVELGRALIKCGGGA